MKNRRHFLKVSLGLITGIAFLLNPFVSIIRMAQAKVKKFILPKGTEQESLIHRDPDLLDTRNLDITPLNDFRTMGLSNHQVNLEEWRLEILDPSKTTIKLNYSEIIALPSIERKILMICPGIFVIHGHWKGVSVNELFKMANIETAVSLVTFSGPQGEHERNEAYEIEDILSDRVFLAYEVNGEPLPRKHGFPLRIVAEGYYGFRWLKYVYKMQIE